MGWPLDLAADARSEIWSVNKGQIAKSTDPLDRISIFKAESKAEEAEERVVFGEVLVPEERDLQGDIYSAKEVEAAAHRYLADYRRGKTGEQHERRLTNEVSLLESYVAPVDFIVNGRSIKKGTWLMKWKIHDDALWIKVKNGEITGFSIGGQARSDPG